MATISQDIVGLFTLISVLHDKDEQPLRASISAKRFNGKKAHAQMFFSKTFFASEADQFLLV